MKKLIGIFVGLIFVSCGSTPAGTMNEIDKGGNDSIEIYRYYYDDGNWVYISKFKSQPNVVTATWQQQQGKFSTTVGNIILYENDSVRIVQETK